MSSRLSPRRSIAEAFPSRDAAHRDVEILRRGESLRIALVKRSETQPSMTMETWAKMKGVFDLTSGKTVLPKQKRKSLFPQAEKDASYRQLKKRKRKMDLREQERIACKSSVAERRHATMQSETERSRQRDRVQQAKEHPLSGAFSLGMSTDSPERNRRGKDSSRALTNHLLSGQDEKSGRRSFAGSTHESEGTNMSVYVHLHKGCEREKASPARFFFVAIAHVFLSSVSSRLPKFAVGSFLVFFLIC